MEAAVVTDYVSSTEAKLQEVESLKQEAEKLRLDGESLYTAYCKL